jgi:2-keto-4-pentenoate hydratase/2-oxohepta-3-ene-1,7-dioic acid hydratase in catechol pathway
MKIICIGRNYADHAKEMNAAVPKSPVFFMKPDTALLLKNAPFYYPDFTNDLHYECEIIVKISKAGKNIQPEFAGNYFSEIGLGIDFTARDLQQNCKEKSLPWEIAKAFDHSAVVGEFFIDKSTLDLNSIEFSLFKNEVCVQKGNTSDMIFTIEELIAYVSTFVTLKTGDLIFTGTPAGVGPVQIGDRLIGKIGDNTFFNFEIK